MKYGNMYALYDHSPDILAIFEILLNDDINQVLIHSIALIKHLMFILL